MVRAPRSPVAFGRWKIQFCQAERRPKIRVSIVSGPAKPQGRLHPGERVRGEPGPFLDGHPELVLPVEVVGSEGREAALVRLGGGEDPSAGAPGAVGVAIEPRLQPREPVRHREGAVVEGGQRDPGGTVRIVAEIGAVRREQQLGERPHEPLAGFGHRKEAAGGLVEPAERPAHPVATLGSEPDAGETVKTPVRLPDGFGVTRRPEQDHPELRLVEAEPAERVVELPRHPQVPDRRARRRQPLPVLGERVLGSVHGHRRRPFAPVETEFDMAIADGVEALIRFQGIEDDAALLAAGGIRGRRRERRRPFPDAFLEAAPRREAVHEAPLERPAAADPLGEGREHVGAVAPDLPFVDDPGQTARSREHAQQRHFRKRDGRAAVVHQEDLVAGEREFVAAAGAGAAHGSQVLLVAPKARLLDVEPGLVRVLAEVHLEPVGGAGQHEDVGARREDPVESTPDHHRPDPRVLGTATAPRRPRVRCPPRGRSCSA